MILDFLTAGLKARAAAGQPLLTEAMRNVYRTSAKTFGEKTGLREEAFTEDLRAVSKFLESSGGSERILFVRPKAESNARSALGRFAVIELEDGPSIDPKVIDGVLHLPVMRWNWLTWKSISAEEEGAWMWTQWLLCEIAELLSAIDPKLICFALDLPPLERAFSVVAQSMGIPTATIQDGVFSSKVEPSLLFGEASDYFIVWSDYTKRLLDHAGVIPSERILVSGYPYPLQALLKLRPAPRAGKTVVMIGQNFEIFDERLGQAKAHIIALVRAACASVGLSFKYRPHPGERLDSYAQIVPKADRLSPQEPLIEMLSRYEVFTGISSTVLIEAALVGKTVIQIYDDQFQFENLGELGACHSCLASATSIQDLFRELASGNLTPLKVNPDYVLVPSDPAARLLEAFGAIVDGWEAKPAKRLVCAGEPITRRPYPPGDSTIDESDTIVIPVPADDEAGALSWLFCAVTALVGRGGRRIEVQEASDPPRSSDLGVIGLRAVVVHSQLVDKLATKSSGDTPVSVAEAADFVRAALIMALADMRSKLLCRSAAEGADLQLSSMRESLAIFDRLRGSGLWKLAKLVARVRNRLRR